MNLNEVYLNTLKFFIVNIKTSIQNSLKVLVIHFKLDL